MQYSRRAAIMTGLAVILSAGFSLAQTTAPSFDVASVKRNATGAAGEQVRVMPGGRLEVRNMTLRMLVQQSYRVMPFQISGGPKWMDSSRFDIVARADGDTGADALFLRLKTLLEERFALKAHREIREQSVYLLTTAKSGAKVERAEGTCVARDPNHPELAPRPGERAPNYCGNMRRGRQSLEGQGEKLSDQNGFTLGTLTGQLSSILDRPVLDRTGLTGIFNFHLQWMPEQGDDAGSPSIFTALQEQLGLKLEAGKGPVELLVIDQAEEPADN
ncbi:MAG TPA: TIGR03435 family protein [Bryobacteraceae bacterium]|jgi:uncharacterized protein (TIGR03435 family)|nr:TIGR03435 family protein [Bryobacteraceae bacterium]